MSAAQSRQLGRSELQVPPIGLGTWSIGGLHWGKANDPAAREAITASIQNGVTLIDTAPIYGFGHAEELLGKLSKKAAFVIKSSSQRNVGSNGQRTSERSDAIRILIASEQRLRRVYVDFSSRPSISIKSTGLMRQSPSPILSVP